MKHSNTEKCFFGLKSSKTAAICCAAAALIAAQAVAADAGATAAPKGLLESGWGFVQSLFGDSAPQNKADNSRAQAVQSNVLGIAAARELQVQAEAQLQQREFLGAEMTLNRALSLAPDLPSTQALLAVVIDAQGRSTEAQAMLNRMVRADTLQTGSGSAKLEDLAPAAAAHVRLGNPQRGLQIYNDMLASNIETAALHAGRGDALRLLGDDVAALAAYQLAAEIEPRFPQLEMKRAASLEKLGRLSEAENAYRAALQVDPTSNIARNNLQRLEALGAAADASADAAAKASVATPAFGMAASAAASTEPTRRPAKPVSSASVKARPSAANAAEVSVVKLDAVDAVGATKAVAQDAVDIAQAAVLKQLGLWQAAWSNKEIESYLGFYAKDFAPVKMQRAEWEADRRAKVSKPGPIQINIIEPSFESRPGAVSITFIQEYASKNFRNKARKRIDWVQEGAEWRIQREVTL